MTLASIRRWAQVRNHIPHYRCQRIFKRLKRFAHASHRAFSQSTKKSGWNGSLTLPLSRGEKKKYQTNRIQTQCSPTALQSDSATSGSETCARDRCGFHGAILRSMESCCAHALCTTDPLL